jgi:TatD DNase family protein
MIDAHAHVHDSAFDIDRAAMLERARLAGIESVITIGTDLAESRSAIECAAQYSFVWASVGIHPHVFNTVTSVASVAGLTEELKKMLPFSQKIVAIGECGLDYFTRDATQHITEQQKEVQKAGFLAQVALAQERSLPLIIHTRPSLDCMDAYDDMQALLQSVFASYSGAGRQHPYVILHCYMGDARVTQRFLDFPQMVFSFTGNITYKARTGGDLDRVLDMIPVERLLVETDCPYLAPVPYRGKRNEPAYATLVARHVAEMKKISYTLLEEQLQKNTQRIFPQLTY